MVTSTSVWSGFQSCRAETWAWVIALGGVGRPEGVQRAVEQDGVEGPALAAGAGSAAGPSTSRLSTPWKPRFTTRWRVPSWMGMTSRRSCPSPLHRGGPTLALGKPERA